MIKDNEDKPYINPNLSEIEKAYLSCLINGADVQDENLILNDSRLEKIHLEVKRYKKAGLVEIPKKLFLGAIDLDYDENPISVEFYFNEIREEHRKRDIIKLAETYKKDRRPSDMQIMDLKAELEDIAKRTGRMDIISAEELQKKDYKNTEFIIPRILPVGLTILMGAPKKGKSWLLLLMAEAITNGYELFGRKSQKVPVLYFTLEDSVKRFKYRLSKIKGELVPGAVKNTWSKNFYFCEKPSNGNADIIKGIRETGARVVIIDTMAAYFTDIKDGNDYHETTRLTRQLKEIADNLQVAIICVTHTKKNENENGDWTAGIMGSQGWVGAADTLMRLNRKEKKGQLLITGRDIDDVHLYLLLDDGYWRVDQEEEDKHNK